MIRVALIDDHESVRLGLEAACARSGTKEVVFSGSTVRCYLDWRAESGAAPADVVVLESYFNEGSTKQGSSLWPEAPQNPKAGAEYKRLWGASSQ